MATTKMMTALQVRTKPAPDTNPRASNAINNMVVSATGDPSPALRARAYQTEMYEKSIEDNIIVVMDTGTGKTLVAALRIKHELATAGSNMRIWFLVPTVALCKQQCDSLQRQLPSVTTQHLSSDNRVENWRTQQIWDSALRSVRVVVATYAVLQNALSDGFVKMDSVALIVFDEAHNCVGKSPGSKIMRDFYWRDKNAGRPVPRIMGMTASPTNKTGRVKLQKLEGTLDATCRSPQIQRESFEEHVNRPVLTVVYYDPRTATMQGTCRGIASMCAILKSLDLQIDPEMIRYRTENTEWSRAQVASVVQTGRGTLALDQLHTFCGRAERMSEALGTLAADIYIAKSVMPFLVLAQTGGGGLRPATPMSSASASTSASRLVDHTMCQNWSFSSVAYLARLLRNVPVDMNVLTKAPTTSCVSAKFNCLVRILLGARKGKAMDDNSSRAIVFVEERATAVVLHHLLSLSQLKDHFRVGCLLGSSKHDRGRRDLGDISSTADQSDTLGKFRSGQINLMVATSVAEEGLDISACNLVVCFDPPMSPKSFIQRRGRARRAGSSYFLLVDKTIAEQEKKDWEDIVAQLRAEYEREDQASARQDASAALEIKKTSYKRFVQPETEAVLDMENAKARLQQLCAVARGGRGRRFADTQHPYYIFKEMVDEEQENNEGDDVEPLSEGSEDAPPLVKAKVVLPLACVPHGLRTTWSKKAWRTQRNASKDAAFEAFMRLYHAGLVNNWLQPLTDAKAVDGGDDMSGLIDITEQINPWVRVRNEMAAQLRPSYTLLLDDNSGSRLRLNVAVPAPRLDDMLPFSLRLGDVVWDVRVEPSTSPYSPWMGERGSSNRTDGVKAREGGRQRQPELVVAKAFANADATLQTLTPHVLYKVEAHLVALELRSRIFVDVSVPDTAVYLIRSAITTPVRAEAELMNLEFIGDACLQLLTTVSLAAKYPFWQEGYLSTTRNKLICNASLSRAALQRKVDHFLLTKPFAATDASPGGGPQTQSQSNKMTRSRQVARRTLAHTVKALVGAGRQSGGYEAALGWAKALLPDSIDLPSLEVGRMQLYDLAASTIPVPEDLAMIERLTGYTFRKKSLLVEALTHASDLSSVHADHGCYDRLAFLGNAFIEALVSDAIYRELMTGIRKQGQRQQQEPRTGSDGNSDADGSCSLGIMSQLRAALVNRNYLGYLAMTQHVSQTRTEVNPVSLRAEHHTVRLPLWKFLRHSSPAMADEMAAAEARFAHLQSQLAEAVTAGDVYPWLLLARLRANDCYADVIESLVGAVFVDCGLGSARAMDECKGLLTRMGVLTYLRRIVRDEVDVVHPKERLLVLAGGKEVRYETAEYQQEREKGKEKGWRCDVFVGQSLVAGVEGAETQDEAHIRAAMEGISRLAS